MAFRRRTSRSRSSYRGGYARSRSYSSRPRRKTARRRSSPRQQTVRIVLEQPQAQLSRDMAMAGLVPARGPRKATF